MSSLTLSRLFAALLGCAVFGPAGAQPSQPAVPYSTGRFAYALPPGWTQQTGERSIYRLAVSTASVRDASDTRTAFERQRAKLMKGPHPGGVVEFDMPGLGPAAWLATDTVFPEQVTVLAMKQVATGQVLFLSTELDVDKKEIAEKFVTKIADAYVPHSTSGFSVGDGAFVVRPSKNERASDTFAGPSGMEIQIQTETVGQPDDGQSSSIDAPPGGKLTKSRRRVGGLKGSETRVQLAESDGGPHLLYMWIFAGKAADGAAPRIRLSISGELAQVAALDAAWQTLLYSWSTRDVGLQEQAK